MWGRASALLTRDEEIARQSKIIVRAHFIQREQ